MLPPEELTETPVSLIIMRLSVDFFLFKFPSKSRENHPLQGQNLREVIPGPLLWVGRPSWCVFCPLCLSARLGGPPASSPGYPREAQVRNIMFTFLFKCGLYWGHL